MKVEPKDIRESQGLSQLQMAVKADVSIGTIVSFESGTLSPTLRTLRKLSESYGISINDIEATCGQPSPSVGVSTEA